MISSLDVQQKTFRERFRGYDPDDIEAFLDTVVEALRSHEIQAKTLQQRIDELDRELAGSREAEEAIKRTFLAAQRTSQEIVGEAQDKSARMVERARAESDELLRSAHAESASIRERATKEHEDLNMQLARLRTTVSDLQNRLRSTLEGSLVDLEGMATSIDLETESISDLLGAAASQTTAEPQTVATEPAPTGADAPAAEAPLVSEAGQAAGTDGEGDHENREVAYLQQPRNLRPWDRPGEAG